MVRALEGFLKECKINSEQRCRLFKATSSSSVGYRTTLEGQRFQQIILTPGCRFGEIVHEIGHCVRLFHEQTRPDRDQCVKILWDNIIPEAVSNFVIDPLTVANGPYD